MRYPLLLAIAMSACAPRHEPEQDTELRAARMRLYFEPGGIARPQLYHPLLPFLRSDFAASVYPEVRIADSSFLWLRAVYQRMDAGDSLKLTKVTIRSGGDSLVLAQEQWGYHQFGGTPDGRIVEQVEFQATGPELEAILVPEPTTVILSGSGGTREYKLEIEERLGWGDVLYYFRHEAK